MPVDRNDINIVDDFKITKNEFTMNSGFLFAIATGILFGIHGFLGKIFGKNVSITTLTWANFFFSLPYLYFALAIDGIPSIIWKDFLLGTGLSLMINVIAWNLFFRALSYSNLSHTMPFSAFTPIFLVPVAYILLNELPDTRGFIGLFMIFIGGYGIHIKSGNLLDPIKSLFHDKGTRYMLLVAAMWSISAAAEKVAVISSSQAFFGSVIQSLLALAYFPFVKFNHEFSREKRKVNIGKFFILGLVTGSMLLVQFTALQTILASYVIAFKRAGLLISILLGIIFLREKNPVKNLLFASFIVLGMFLMIN